MKFVVCQVDKCINSIISPWVKREKKNLSDEWIVRLDWKWWRTFIRWIETKLSTDYRVRCLDACANQLRYSSVRHLKSIENLVFLSEGIRPIDFLGNFYMTNATEMIFGAIDSDKSVSVELKHDDKLPIESNTYIQVVDYLLLIIFLSLSPGCSTLYEYLRTTSTPYSDPRVNSDIIVHVALSGVRSRCNHELHY